MPFGALMALNFAYLAGVDISAAGASRFSLGAMMMMMKEKKEEEGKIEKRVKLW